MYNVSFMRVCSQFNKHFLGMISTRRSHVLTVILLIFLKSRIDFMVDMGVGQVGNRRDYGQGENVGRND